MSTTLVAGAGTHAALAGRAPAFGGGRSLDQVRADFPILATEVHGHPLAYLDNAASTQKPRAVIDALSGFLSTSYANVSRGVHTLSQRATAARDAARETVRRFLGAASAKEIVFVRGTTEAINLVAQTLGRERVGPGDAVLVTALEHHSNFVPWQRLCEESGARLDVAPLDRHGQVDLDEFERLLGPRTRIAAFVHVSNVLGTVLPVAAMAERAHAYGAVVVVDGAQGAPHLPIDVRSLGCDFYAFSGHKVYGPSGIGALYGRRELLAAMAPWQAGGGMIETVSRERTTYAPPPERFEAGTPHIEGAVGLAAAIDYLEGLGLDAIAAWEEELLKLALASLAAIRGLRIVGDPTPRASVVSFVMDGVHPHDIGTILDGSGIAVRAGHHCAQPLMEHLGLPATTRASFSFYNTPAEVEALAGGLARVRELFT